MIKNKFYYSQNDQSIRNGSVNALNAMIQGRSNNNQKPKPKFRMPVTEQDSTVKIAFLMRKYCKKIQFIIVKIVKTKRQNKVILTKKVKSKRPYKVLLSKTFSFFSFRKLNFFAIFSH